MRSSLVFPLNLLKTSRGSFSSAGVSGSEIKESELILFYKSMGVILGLPSSSASSKSMSSSLSESDSINCSTLVLNFACGVFFSRVSNVMFLLETGDDFVLGGDIFGRKFISSRPAQTRIIEATFQNCPSKFYTTSNTLPYSYFSACLISQCCVEARAGRCSHPSQS